MRKSLIIAGIITPLAVTGLAIGTANASGHHNHTTVYNPPVIVLYEFTYHSDGTLAAVTTEDSSNHITSFPCGPKAVAVNGNYSIECSSR